jgi:membrane fusion protein (multidrug efflux system)
MKYWKWLVLVVILLAGLAAIGLYSRHEKLYPETENAYVDATAIRISSQIDGPVVSVPVSSLAQVKKGELLVLIDKSPFQAEVDASAAQLLLAKREAEENMAELESALAELEDAKVHVRNAREQLKRLASLKTQSYSSIQQTEDAEAVYQRAIAGQKVAEAKLEKARVRIAREEGSEEDLLIQEARARFEKAGWELRQTRIVAPCQGVLETVGVHGGETVKAHSTLMVLVCTDKFWVDANFKETQMERIRPGQSVTIKVDMYPNQVFEGVVENLSPASGTAFSLLPPQNATGNWVKTTQRIPVRIRVLQPDPRFPLRVGASTTVKIDTSGLQL